MNIKFFIKAAVSLLILFVLFASIDVEKLGDVIVNADVAILMAALGFVLSIRFVMAYRWQIVLRLYGVFSKYWNLLSIVFISNSVGHLLPGGIGVDVVRSYQLSKQEGVVAGIVASVFIDRVVGLLSMLLVAFVAALLGFLFNDLSLIYAVLTGGGIVAFFAMYSLRSVLAGIQYDRFISKGPLKIACGAFGKFVKSLSDVSLPNKIVLKLLILSTLVQMIRVLVFFLVFLALDVQLEFTLLMVFIPLLFIVMLMPVSIGGLGVREGALFLFLNPYGVSIEVCTAAGLLFHLLQIISLLPGVLLYFLRK